MKAKSFIVLLAMLVVLVAGTGVSAAYLVQNGQADSLEITADGEAYAETVTLENFIPGMSETVEYTVKSEGKATFGISFAGDAENAFNRCLVIDVFVDGNAVLEDKPFAECVASAAECEVNGDFELTVVYTLGAEAGNEVQGAVSEFVTYYTLKK